MELKYRGVSYRTFPTSVKIEGKKNQVCFRGCSYTLTEATVNLPECDQAKPAAFSDRTGIVYRGVSENTMVERRFLGNKYFVNPVKLIPSWEVI